ncbi:unnamed protein product [Phytomonas sp. EM1]|nr:unnamed protein product [Phytomonas sp. EM1]|eukprot:CCW64834.1 unnamed protein product [Phytomonas sp. isolate EM1]
MSHPMIRRFSGERAPSPTPSIWGVLIAQTAPSGENGLLSALRRQPSEDDVKGFLQIHGTGGGLVEALPSNQYKRAVLFESWDRFPPPGTAPAGSCTGDSDGEASVLGSLGCLSGFLPLLLALRGDVVRIGRLSSNDIVLAGNPYISSVHCALFLTSTLERASLAKRGKSHHLGTAVAAGGIEVTFSDYSTNGCHINGVRLGKGKAYTSLRSGDIVELVNAGEDCTEAHNVKLLYLDQPGFARWLAENAGEVQGASVDRVQGCGGNDKLPQREETRPPSRTGQRYKEVMIRARLDVVAQVRRMYNHDVEDFYVLDKRAPPGEGAFGKVYAGALKPMASDANQKGHLVSFAG